jgi:antitoxin component YwqK of YwqJK toxin-antitoxin module
MKKLLTTFALFTIWISYSYACTCEMSKINIQQYIETEIIFAGKIIRVVNNKALAENQITFEIKQEIKGLPRGRKTFDVNTPDYGGMCGISGEVGEEWLIWTYSYNGKVYTSICTHSNLLSKVGEDLKIIKSFKEKANYNWYQDGKLVANGKMINNIPVGKWKFFKKEKLNIEGGFLDGKKDGDWITYSLIADKPIKSSSIRYEKGEYVSRSRFYENGNLSEFRRQYADTGLVDMEVDYYKNGAIRNKITYNDNKIFSDKSYYEDGKLAIDHQYAWYEVPYYYRIYDREGKQLDTYIHHINLDKETGLFEIL